MEDTTRSPDLSGDFKNATYRTMVCPPLTHDQWKKLKALNELFLSSPAIGKPPVHKRCSLLFRFRQGISAQGRNKQSLHFLFVAYLRGGNRPSTSLPPRGTEE